MSDQVIRQVSSWPRWHRFNVSVLSGLEPHTEILRVSRSRGDGHMRGFMVAMTGDRP